MLKLDRFLTLAAASCLTASLATAQDECATAVPVGLGSTPFDTTTGTLSPEPWTCVASTAPDLWFAYTAGASTYIAIDTCGSSYDTALMVFDACGGLEVACNDDGSCGTQSEVDFIPVAGTTYFIRVGGWTTSVGAGTLNISEALTPLVNDECAFALPVGGGTSLTDTSLATTSAQPWSCSGTTIFSHGRDLWFSYTPASSGDFTINTCNPGTAFDTVLEVFTGDCGALSVAACNDDVACAFGSFRSAVTLCGLAGQTYTFRIGSYAAGASGLVEFNIVEAPPAPNCVSTLFIAGNGGSIGGMVYFNATFTQDVVIGGFDTNTNIAAGTPVNADVYITPGTYVGVTGIPALWTLVASGTGISTALGTPPTHIDFNEPLVVPAGTYGVAIHAVDFNHRYTTGAAPTVFASPDGVISLLVGAASNTPFAAGIFSPRLWNGGFCYDLNIGTTYCASNANSTGAVAGLIVGGTNCVVLDSLVLTATHLPLNSFGYFLCSTTPGMGTPPNSQGVLCLGGSIGRAVGGSIYNSGTIGVMRTTSSLTLPHPSLGTIQVMAGDTWHYQGWYRDSVGGNATSNLTDGVSLTYH